MAWLQSRTWKRVFFTLFLTGMVWQLAGCDNDKEPEQRKAFIQFLQTRILPSEKLSVPTLTAQEKESFGKYADDYAILSDYSSEMTTAFSGNDQAMRQMRGVTSAKDMVEKRETIEKSRKEVGNIESKRADTMKSVEERYSKLKQPDDLKAVFDQAYQKTVVRPNALLTQTLSLTDAILGQALDIGNYLNSLGNKVQYTGAMAQFTDQKQLDLFNEKLSAMREKQQELLTVARQLAGMQ
ncbi:DUF3053 family protein [Cronobacter sakazakii]|uniref:DUF3053 family protein n=1 Tax=Cronobacter sakazakii TaxID=28141 RepID=UPI0007AB9AF2|nr:DUF3053 family protein [Cronobacter sakazakii]ELY4033110.1 DUF3053 domain-containing protein [Cronobacter sakazakii]ELY5869955.1 DUF3053 domain-containing protein [Cronobacter sakazakii]KZE23703.1 hypothetical protein AVZ29_02850 [Cronobacter sakazakii]